jgi:hypothetical protein
MKEKYRKDGLEASCPPGESYEAHFPSISVLYMKGYYHSQAPTIRLYMPLCYTDAMARRLLNIASIVCLVLCVALMGLPPESQIHSAIDRNR